EYLDPAIRSQTKYFNTLANISFTESEIVQVAEVSRRYINENVLWTRSTQPLLSNFVPGPSERWFTYRSAWTEVGPRLIADVKNRPVSWCTAILAIAVLIAARYRLRERITEIGMQTSQSKFAGFRPTFQAFLLTIAAASPVAIAFWFLGDRMSSIAGDDRTMIALAVAANIFGSAYMLLELVRQVCRTKGLAECHLEWPQHTLVTVRRKLRLLLYAAVPLLTMASFLSAGAQGYGKDVLERYFFIGALSVLCVFMVQTLHPRRGAPARFLGAHPNGWANRLSSVWYPLMIAIPVLLGLLSVLGYHFTSWQLGWRFLQSVALLFGIVVVISLAMRWSIIHRRQLRIEQLRQQRANAESEAPKGDVELPITLADEGSDEELREQMRQSRSLFMTIMVAGVLAGLWIVWSDVIPALDQLDKWPAWRSTTTVTEWIKNDKGNDIASTYEVPDPVTYAEIVFAIIIMAIAFAATRNLPGLLEFAVLRRLPLDRSARYAITTLVRYGIIMVGIVVAGGTIGLHWNQIQWMATALTFGLAFGLQEMFANFIAGIIILFEQPVRVGDVVQIDGVTGIVSKIRMRATTITDWDRKDYIVPNKEFITGKLLNWTRSDEIVRLTIPVGIAYGSDTKLARQLLLQAAKEQEGVLSDPPVLATFERFGESSLDFALRVFVNTYERRLHICNDLHMAIDQKFREANIEISFPQRDLHLRSFPEEMVRYFRGSGDSLHRRNESNPHRE
ncbi:MAG: mechanosensitive ion channel, partial [Planctomycetales bacterium]|nr:mechanosensitive ion channel [Planctomycetales bacterium]